jgi:hypothetical protein
MISRGIIQNMLPGKSRRKILFGKLIHKWKSIKTDFKEKVRAQQNELTYNILQIKSIGMFLYF